MVSQSHCGEPASGKADLAPKLALFGLFADRGHVQRLPEEPLHESLEVRFELSKQQLAWVKRRTEWRSQEIIEGEVGR